MWVEKQTGVAYTTLRRHYARWMPTGKRTEVRRLAGLADGPIDPAEEEGESPELCPLRESVGAQSSQDVENEEGSKCEEGDLNLPAPTKTEGILSARRSRRVKNGHELMSRTSICQRARREAGGGSVRRYDPGRGITPARSRAAVGTRPLRPQTDRHPTDHAAA